jgi:hypothetical protein
MARQRESIEGCQSSCAPGARAASHDHRRASDTSTGCKNKDNTKGSVISRPGQVAQQLTNYQRAEIHLSNARWCSQTARDGSTPSSSARVILRLSGSDKFERRARKRDQGRTAAITERFSKHVEIARHVQIERGSPSKHRAASCAQD